MDSIAEIRGTLKTLQMPIKTTKLATLILPIDLNILSKKWMAPWLLGRFSYKMSTPMELITIQLLKAR